MAQATATAYPGTARTRRDVYENLRSRLESIRKGGGFDAHWKELAEFLMPRRTRFFAGDKNRTDHGRNRNIIDSTARFAWRTLASGLHAGLTSPARPWMRLTTPDPTLAEFRPVKEWLHLVTQRMLAVFARSNLYNSLPKVYGDMGGFGTAAMAMLPDDRDLFRTYVYPLGAYTLGLDARGLATTFTLEYQRSVRQVVEEFGVQPNGDIDWSPISSNVKRLWLEGSYEQPVDLCWVVMPNELRDDDRLGSRFLPWASCHYEKGNDERKFLRESGFRAFPILAPRWEVTGDDAYGTDCPGMTALGDVKQLQAMQRKKGQAIAKMVDPPLVGPPAVKSQKVSLLPGDVSIDDARTAGTGLRPIHETNLNIEHLSRDVVEVQFRIQRAFYEDLFLMLARRDPYQGSQPVTAREVEERHEEKLLALGPVLESTNDELLDPLIDRAFLMMLDAGLIPPPPPELEGMALQVEYISILAQAQKAVGVLAQDRFIQATAPLVEVFPEIRHKVDIFQVVDNYAEMLGVDPRIVRPDEEAEELAAAEAEATQAQAGADQAKTTAEAMRAAAAAPLETGSALDALVRGQ